MVLWRNLGFFFRISCEIFSFSRTFDEICFVLGFFYVLFAFDDISKVFVQHSSFLRDYLTKFELFYNILMKTKVFCDLLKTFFFLKKSKTFLTKYFHIFFASLRQNSRFISWPFDRMCIFFLVFWRNFQFFHYILMKFTVLSRIFNEICVVLCSFFIFCSFLTISVIFVYNIQISFHDNWLTWRAFRDLMTKSPRFL